MTKLKCKTKATKPI